MSVRGRKNGKLTPGKGRSGGEGLLSCSGTAICDAKKMSFVECGRGATAKGVGLRRKSMEAVDGSA